jgi:tetratricopeptide (TPR) repeat protein
VLSAAVAAKPDDQRQLFNLGLVYRDAARFEEALAAIDRALALQPGDPAMRWDRALVLLHLGRYAEGWQDYATRWEIGEISRPPHRQPLWQGERLAGKTILLYPEQGFGDTILASRFIPRVKELGGRVILECKPPLRRLSTGLAGVERLVSLGALRDGFDCHCSLMDLPGLLGLEAERIPAPARLGVPPEAQARAKRLLASAQGRFKVGVVWSGSVTYKGNRKRSAALQRFLDLAAVPGLQLYSLYKGPLERELRESGAGPLLSDLGSHDADLADTAAVIEQLDLVVMTDSAVAHLAGSLGRPIWNLLGFSPYWVYGAAGETTPWYPSMRLFRQPAGGDWDAVFERVKDELAAAVAAKQAGAWPPAPA